jgi:hypothetical protein
MTEYNLKYATERKIKQRMDILQGWMEENYHLKRPAVVEEHIKTITKFWSAMQDEDKDYVHGCRYAIENKSDWSVK